MTRRFFNIYQYIAFIILFPLAFCLWQSVLFNKKLTIVVLGLPILVSYIIPLIGTNITKFWSFNIKNKTMNIRLYHGFVFGSATSIIGFWFYLISPDYTGILSSLVFAAVCGGFFAFWNTLYDAYAVKCGFIKLNNIAAKNNKSSLEIVCDYAPVYFYTFGFIYALFIKTIEYFSCHTNRYFSFIIAGFYMISLAFPILVYMCFHYIKYRDWGLWGCCK